MSKTAKLPSLAVVKRFLYADWALRVKKRDGFRCLLCGSTENLTAHHWYVCDHHAHAARYCVDNGATLCYACHIRGVHQRADWKSVNKVMAFVMAQGFETGAGALVSMANMDMLAETELTTDLLRAMWTQRRANPVQTPEDALASITNHGKKLFVHTYGHQIAVVNNTITVGGSMVYNVLVVTKTAEGYRYTVKRVEDGK